MVHSQMGSIFRMHFTSSTCVTVQSLHGFFKFSPSLYSSSVTVAALSRYLSWSLCKIFLIPASL
jgi:hypothetical protein